MYDEAFALQRFDAFPSRYVTIFAAPLLYLNYRCLKSIDIANFPIAFFAYQTLQILPSVQCYCFPKCPQPTRMLESDLL